jgi:hypothetical protein
MHFSPGLVKCASIPTLTDGAAACADNSTGCWSSNLSDTMRPLERVKADEDVERLSGPKMKSRL